ncbi:MAG TPA: DUF2092 domain-containing protein [Halococcus sp.]|nr:DUF2092 domain-containing protein [Halococcus sp.]
MNSPKRLGVVIVTLAVLFSAGTAGALTATPTGVDRTAHDAHTDTIVQPIISQNIQEQSESRSVKDILRAAQQSYRQIEDVNATLVATTEISNDTTSVSRTTKAKLSFERPNKFRLEILAPEEQEGTVIVSNGTTITLYNARTDTVRTINASVLGGTGMMGMGAMRPGMMNQMPLDSPRQVGNVLSQSNVTYEGTATVNGHETYVLSVTPKNTSEAFSTDLTLYLDKQSYLPLKTVSETTTTVRGETTTITVTVLVQDLQVNTGIPDSVFEFGAPSDEENAEQPPADEGDEDGDEGASVCAPGSTDEVLGENDQDDDGDGAIDEDDEDNEGPSNDDDDGDGAVDEDDECDDGDDGADDFNSAAEDDEDGDGAVDEDDEPDSGNSDDIDNDGDGAVDEDDELDNDD